MNSYSVSFKATLTGGQAPTLPCPWSRGEGTGPIHPYLAARSLGQLGSRICPSAFVRSGLHWKLWPV